MPRRGRRAQGFVGHDGRAAGRRSQHGDARALLRFSANVAAAGGAAPATFLVAASSGVSSGLRRADFGGWNWNGLSGARPRYQGSVANERGGLKNESIGG